MLVDSRTVGYAAVAAVCGLLLWRLVSIRAYPSAPGPRLARWTEAWYTWKVWGGRFESWNIAEHAAKGKIVRVAPDMYSIDDPPAMKLIYGVGKPMRKGRWYDAFGPVPDHNLFCARNPQAHAAMRKRVADLYSMTAIKQFEPYVDNCIVLLRENLDRMAASREPFDLQHWMQCYAFDVIGEVTFGNRIGFLESGGRDIQGMMASINGLNTFCALLGLNRYLLPFILLKCGGNTFKGMDNLLKQLITTWQKGKDEGITSHCFYDKLHAAKRADPEAYAKYRMDTSPVANVGAGSDTTSISLTAIFYHMAKKKEVYLKLRNEIRSAADRGDISDPITFDQAQKLPYLQQVIKEALRIHPATGLPIWRELAEPGATIAGKYFPAGSTVGINTWVAHSNASVFGDDAADFRPERWDPSHTPAEKLAAMDRYYFPFGAGTRTCMGKNISLLEMSKLVPELVRRYEFTLLSQELECDNFWFVKQKDVGVVLRRWPITGIKSA